MSELFPPDFDHISYLLENGLDATTMDRLCFDWGIAKDSPDRFKQLAYLIKTNADQGIDWKAGVSYLEEEPEEDSRENKSLSIKSFADVEYEEPQFLIAPYFPSGKLTIVQGDSGVGKTAVMCAIAAHVSTGTPILDHQVDQGNVLIVSVEDDASTLRGRIEASKGDVSCCYFIEEAATAGITFTSPEIESAVKAINAKLVIFDPLQCFLGKADMNKANETRPVLAALAEMAKRNDCAVVIISHMAKGQQKAIYKALGSVDIVAASRSVIYIGRDPDDKDTCIAVHLKCSNAKRGRSIAYQIGEKGGVSWQGYTDLTEEDLERAATRKKMGIEYEDEPIVAVLRAVLADNPAGTFLSYDAFQKFGETVLGYPPASNSNELRKKIDILRIELIRKDQIKVEAEKTRPKEYVRNGKTIQPDVKDATRGIRITPYKVPKQFQTSIGL